MEKYTAQEKEWIKNLESNASSLIMQAIKEIKQDGNIKMLPYLFNLIQPSTHESIRSSIVQLMSEIKVQDAVPLIVHALENRDLGEDYTPLITACWQSGLDFSQHLPVFIKIFVAGDYQTAIESFSVIEESIPLAGPDMQDECIKLLDKLASQVPEANYPFFRELVKVISAPHP
jgi:hypothetical protein